MHRRSICHLGILAALAGAASPLNALPARAAFTVFMPPSGDWNNAANWNTHQEPTGADSAFVIHGATATISTDVPTTSNIFVGQDSGAGTVLMTGGRLTASGLYLGRDHSCIGTWNQAGGALTVANKGLGLEMAHEPNSKAVLTLAGGTITGLQGAEVGAHGLGILTVSGGTLNAAEIDVALTPTAKGSSFIQSGGVSNISGAINIGSSAGGAGVLLASGGALSVGGPISVFSGSNFTVEGKTVAIASKALAVYDGGTMQFDLGSIGVSKVDLGSGRLSVGSGSVLLIDCAAFRLRGAGTKTYTLISHGGYGRDQTFGAVKITGIEPGKASVAYGPATVTLTIQLQ